MKGKNPFLIVRASQVYAIFERLELPQEKAGDFVLYCLDLAGAVGKREKTAIQQERDKSKHLRLLTFAKVVSHVRRTVFRQKDAPLYTLRHTDLQTSSRMPMAYEQVQSILTQFKSLGLSSGDVLTVFLQKNGKRFTFSMFKSWVYDEVCNHYRGIESLQQYKETLGYAKTKSAIEKFYKKEGSPISDESLGSLEFQKAIVEVMLQVEEMDTTIGTWLAALFEYYSHWSRLPSWRELHGEVAARVYRQRSIKKSRVSKGFSDSNYLKKIEKL